MQAVIVILGWTAFAVVLARALQPAANSTAPQAAPFLGGGTPDMHAWQRFHFRPYSMSLLFIAFEMEMMFMYPWAVVFVSEGIKALAEMGMFLAILSVGILYGWREGIFRWQ
ncbi:NADH-quinone oxidoreductase subunit A [Palleronia abyssalis]|uniref:NADH-quinone oxidoreductase subunit n=1 Tax=Palleronia abyssalis TaxID=1501240 RepID=A0A2R8C0C1_9RHOB|nr:NADH-quinone oxidoreductase subunit A [Palleronia abyssalis]SPJ25857.1 NAD(P)H-quinone oxidoreductase subunit 3 [Palleronia abyssalis]